MKSTNHLCVPNTQTTTDTATFTPSWDDGGGDITALAQNVTIAAPTGTPTNGQRLIIRIKDNGTSRTITWNAIFAAAGATLPTATTISKWHTVGLIYNSTAVKWQCVAAVVEA